MSVYQRFYIKTSFPREVEQLILDTLGGTGQLEQDDNGRYLRPISVAIRDKDSVQPARDWSGYPQDEAADTGWYWLASIIDYGSVEAAWVAWSLLNSPLVELVAEDNEVSADQPESPAWVIDSEHHLGKGEPPLGPLV